MNNENVKIKIFLKNKGNLLANAVISFNTLEFGWITIKGFQIWKSKKFNERLQEAINIQPPSVKVYTHYVDQVWFENQLKWFNLEELIHSAFRMMGSNYEDVNEDDIPENL